MSDTSNTGGAADNSQGGQQGQQQGQSNTVLGQAASQGQGQQQQQQQQGEAWGFIDRGTGAFAEGWTEKLPDRLKPAKEHLGKYKTVEEALYAGWNASQLVGKKASGVSVPGPDAKPDEIAAFRKALGVPEKPEGYGLKKPDAMPEGLEWDEKAVGEFSAVAHKHGLPPAAVKELLELHQKNEAGKIAGWKAKREELTAQWKADQLESLRKAWGDNYAAKANLAVRAATTIGLNPSDPKLAVLFDNAEVIQAFSRMGEMLSEDRLISGGVISAMQNPKQQADDIMKNPANPYYKHYWDGDREIVGRVRKLLGAA